MSEQFRAQHEHGEITKNHEHIEKSHNNHEREITSAEKQHGSEKHIEHLAKNVEKQAISGQEIGHTESETPNNHPVIINSQLKDMAFSRSMTRTRKQLSPISRTFSKVVHNSTVDKTSEFVGKTVARPMSMFWGAIFAFIGTSALLWITKHYGYEYNYFIAILLFVLGAVVGMAIEGILYLIKQSKSSN